MLVVRFTPSPFCDECLGVCRGRVCRVPFFRTSSPRREALVSAMGEGERDITDMQGKFIMPLLISKSSITDFVLQTALNAYACVFPSFTSSTSSVSESVPLFRN
jgi:hypothetical protein